MSFSGNFMPKQDLGSRDSFRCLDGMVGLVLKVAVRFSADFVLFIERTARKKNSWVWGKERQRQTHRRRDGDFLFYFI